MFSYDRRNLSGDIVAGLTLWAVLFLTALSTVKFLSPLPLPALSGVVLVAAVDLINFKSLREMWRLRRADFWIAIAAGAAVVFLGMPAPSPDAVGAPSAEAAPSSQSWH